MQSYEGFRRSAASALLLGVTVACGDGRSSNAAAPSRTSGSPPTLVNGTMEIGDVSVGAVFVPSIDNRLHSATGTLIGRRTALIAAHSMYDQLGQLIQSAQICFYPCGCVNNCAGTCINGTPQIYPGFNPNQHNPEDFDHDLAVLNLAQDVTTLGLGPYMVPRRIGATPVVGAGIQLVGYGVSSRLGTDYGQKRYGYSNISDVGSEKFHYQTPTTTSPYAAPGDSGGPVFKAGSDCEIGVINGVEPDGANFANTRIDTKLAWVQQVASDSSVYACGVTVCGDGFCQDPENCTSCPQDCGPCPCNSVNCPNGCCDSNNICQTPGNVWDACGSNATLCDVCHPVDNGYCRSCPGRFICLQPNTRCPP